MPGENLPKLSKEELRQLRAIVAKVYFKEQGVSEARMKQFVTSEECDKLIDSLLPETVEKLRERGINSGFIEKKKFFMPSKIVGVNGKPIMKDG